MHLLPFTLSSQSINNNNTAPYGRNFSDAEELTIFIAHVVECN